MSKYVLFLIAALSFISKTQAADIAISAAQQQSLGITVTAVGKNTSLTSRRFPAEISIPIGQERVVSAAQSGLIDQLYTAAGQQVKKGQAIAHMTSPDLLGLQRDYVQALIQKKLASKSLTRDAELFKDGIIAERRYIETSSAHEDASASLAQRRQTLKLAGMSDAAINKLTPSSGMTSGMVLTAPMGGQVLEQMVTTGQRVDMGTPLYRIANLNKLWLEIHAPLEGLPFVKTGMPVQIPKLQAIGQLIAVIRSVNKADQTLHLRAEITQGAEKLSPGQMVEAEISLGEQSSYFSVPKATLARQGAQAWVFVQIKNGFKAQKVSVISEQGDEVLVNADFKGDEKIAISGITAIKGIWLGLGGE